MNSLSWLLYFADAVSGVSLLIGISSTLIILGFAVAAIPALVGKYDAVIGDGGKFFDQIYVPLFKRVMPVVGVMVVLSALVPSRQTILMIAASEAGERVIKSRELGEVVDPAIDLIKSWIRKETERMKSGE